MFTFRRNQIVILKTYLCHPRTFDFINIGTIRKVKYRFNIFKETEYLIYLSDGISYSDEMRCSCWLRWIKESEIKKIKD